MDALPTKISGPSHLRTYCGYGFDLSYLDILLRRLCNLNSLHVTALACDTSRLKRDGQLRPADNLGELVLLQNSLLNSLRSDFDQHQAARYISALLKPTAKFTLEPTPPCADSYEWEEFVADSNQFKEGFAKRVKEYMEIREGEFLRVPREGSSGDKEDDDYVDSEDGNDEKKKDA